MRAKCTAPGETPVLKGAAPDEAPVRREWVDVLCAPLGVPWSGVCILGRDPGAVILVRRGGFLTIPPEVTRNTKEPRTKQKERGKFHGGFMILFA